MTQTPPPTQDDLAAGLSLEEEILAALREIGPDGASGFQITRWIESRSPKRPWRFLWWHGEMPRIIGFGTLYRALASLHDRGLVTRTRYDDRDPPRFVYRLVASKVERECAL